MEPDFIKEAEQQGWHVVQVNDDHLVAKCPALGCGLHARLDVGRNIPRADPESTRNRSDMLVASFDDLRRGLRRRRENLSLTIPEVEMCSGIAGDHLAKMEKDNPVKTPSINAVIDWANSLGFDVVLRPSGLPAYTRRVLADTRDKVEARQKRFDRERKKRAG